MKRGQSYVKKLDICDVEIAKRMLLLSLITHSLTLSFTKNQKPKDTKVEEGIISVAKSFVLFIFF